MSISFLQGPYGIVVGANLEICGRAGQIDSLYSVRATVRVRYKGQLCVQPTFVDTDVLRPKFGQTKATNMWLKRERQKSKTKTKNKNCVKYPPIIRAEAPTNKLKCISV